MCVVHVEQVALCVRQLAEVARPPYLLGVAADLAEQSVAVVGEGVEVGCAAAGGPCAKVVLETAVGHVGVGLRLRWHVAYDIHADVRVRTQAGRRGVDGRVVVLIQHHVLLLVGQRSGAFVIEDDRITLKGHGLAGGHLHRAAVGIGGRAVRDLALAGAALLDSEVTCCVHSSAFICGTAGDTYILKRG